MHALTGERLLSAWDRGMTEHDIDRALTMLALAMPGTSREHLAALPITERNKLLLQLRALTFGPLLKGFAICSGCETPLEFSLRTDELLRHAEQLKAETVQQDHLRAVNSNDLLAVLETQDAGHAEDLLLTRCLISGGPEALSLPAIRGEFEALNAAAEMSFALDCPNCSRREMVDFDVARFLWAEIRRAAAHLLSEIHELASAYGWSEEAIATMSAQRRSAYMEMLNT
jgi:hypothetical protein